MQKFLLTILAVCWFFNKAYAQLNPAISKFNDNSSLGIFINPLSFFEIKNALTGLGISYKLSSKWEFAAEPGYVYDVWDKTYRSKGARIILTVKHFFPKGRFFYGLDARAKNYSFDDVQDFYNASTNNALISFRHRVETRFIGFASILGIRTPLSRNKKLLFQFNVGAGPKYRSVYRKNIPEEFQLHERFNRATEWLSPEYNGSPTNGSEKSGYTIYLPIGARFFYFFK